MVCKDHDLINFADTIDSNCLFRKRQTILFNRGRHYQAVLALIGSLFHIGFVI